MKNYFEEIKTKIEKSIKVEDLQIIDNSYKHKTHRFYQSDKYHLKLRIKSMYLSSIPRVKAPKKSQIAYIRCSLNRSQKLRHCRIV